MKRPHSDYFTSQTLTGLFLVLLGTISVTAAIYQALPQTLVIVGTSSVYGLGILLILVGLVLASFRLEPVFKE